MEGKILRVLADLQRKGYVLLWQRVENTFNIKVDLDEFDSALDSLVRKGLLKRDGTLYRKNTPLGDTLSH